MPREFVHVNYTGPPGSGKSTNLREFARRRPRKEIVYVQRATTRRPRPGEIDGEEYRFLTYKEYKRQEEKKMFLTAPAWPFASGVKIFLDTGDEYFRATYHQNFWDPLTSETRWRLSSIGARVSYELQEVIGEEMKSFYLTAKKAVLLDRIDRRPGWISRAERKKYEDTIDLYESISLVDEYDPRYVIHTDDMTPEQIVDETERIIALLAPEHHLISP